MIFFFCPVYEIAFGSSMFLEELFMGLRFGCSFGPFYRIFAISYSLILFSLVDMFVFGSSIQPSLRNFIWCFYSVHFTKLHLVLLYAYENCPQNCIQFLSLAQFKRLHLILLFSFDPHDCDCIDLSLLFWPTCLGLHLILQFSFCSHDRGYICSSFWPTKLPKGLPSVLLCYYEIWLFSIACKVWFFFAYGICILFGVVISS